MREVQDLRNHLTFVREEYRERLGRIPGNVWEAWCYLYTEAEEIFENSESEKARKKAAWLMAEYARMFRTSVSVDGHMITQIKEAMQGDRAPQARPGDALMPQVVVKENPKPRGLLARKD